MVLAVGTIALREKPWRRQSARRPPGCPARGSTNMIRKRVLIVDDSKTTVEVLKVYLMGQDFDFRVARTGDEALKLLGTWPADLVISDVNMPGMDGITLCSELKKSNPVPVIIVTSRLSGETRRAAMLAGADGILPKPLEPHKLAYMANALLAE